MPACPCAAVCAAVVVPPPNGCPDGQGVIGSTCGQCQPGKYAYTCARVHTHTHRYTNTHSHAASDCIGTTCRQSQPGESTQTPFSPAYGRILAYAPSLKSTRSVHTCAHRDLHTDKRTFTPTHARTHTQREGGERHTTSAHRFVHATCGFTDALR